jgi:chromosome segregation ATPase
VRACTYPYLKAEFEQQRDHARADGTQPDPRLAQIERLKAEVTRLRERLAATRAELDDAKIFRGQALSRIAAQHEELAELRIRCAGSGARTTDAISRPPLRSIAPPD